MAFSLNPTAQPREGFPASTSLKKAPASSAALTNSAPVQFGQGDHFVRSKIRSSAQQPIAPRFGNENFIENLSPAQMSAVLSAQLGQKLNGMEVGDILTLGRTPENSLSIPASGVSRTHAAIVKRADGFYLQDRGTAIDGISLAPGSMNGTQHVTFENGLPVIQDIRGPLKPVDELTPAEMALEKIELRLPGPSVKLSQGDIIVLNTVRLHLDHLPLTEKEQSSFKQPGLFDHLPEEETPGFPPKSFDKEWMAKRNAASDAYTKMEGHLEQLKQIYQHPHLIPRVRNTWIQQVQLLQNPEVQFQMYSRLTEMGFGNKLAKCYVLRLNCLARDVSQAIQEQKHLQESQQLSNPNPFQFIDIVTALKDALNRNRFRD
jgi:pSer/pThr/pTyr-binding forkhead associated (FHA) protein